MGRWKQELYDLQEQWQEKAKEVKKTVVASERTKEEKSNLLNHKKKLSKQVKDQMAQLTLASEEQRNARTQANKDQAEKVRKETADAVTDEAKKFMFTKRRASAESTRAQVKSWADEHSKNRTEFRQTLKESKDKSKAMEVSAKGSRKALAAQRAKEAADLRAEKAANAEKHRAALEDHAAVTKQLVYANVTERFIPGSMSRRMFEHPHFAEVTAVVTDVTSQVSKEIANSPRRRPQLASGNALAAGKAPAALRMSPSAAGAKGL